MSAALREIATVADGAMRRIASDRKAMTLPPGFKSRRRHRGAPATKQGALSARPSGAHAARLHHLHTGNPPPLGLTHELVDRLVDGLIGTDEVDKLQHVVLVDHLVGAE